MTAFTFMLNYDGKRFLMYTNGVLTDSTASGVKDAYGLGGIRIVDSLGNVYIDGSGISGGSGTDTSYLTNGDSILNIKNTDGDTQSYNFAGGAGGSGSTFNPDTLEAAIDLKLNISDTAAMLGPYINDADSIAGGIRFRKGNGSYIDVNIPASSGTVTSIATGLGLSGGAITTSGTLLVDTSDASILSRQRGLATYEALLGNPSTNDYVLSSTTSGVRSWVPQSSGGSSNWSVSGGNIYRPNGFVSINDNSPQYRFSLRNANDSNISIRTTFAADSSALVLVDTAVTNAVSLGTITPALVFKNNLYTGGSNRENRFKIFTSGPDLYIYGTSNYTSYNATPSLRLTQGGSLTLGNSGILLNGGTSIITAGSCTMGSSSFSGVLYSAVGGSASSARSFFSHTGTMSNTPTTGLSNSGFDDAPTFNATSNTSTYRGFYYHPTNTNLTGITSIAFENTTGDVKFNTTSGNVILNTPIRMKGYTVAGLPAGTIGDEAYVTDAVLPTYLGVLTGGGAVVTPVFYNGTAWVSH